ncbi:MAG TPA: glycerol-3-phosphate 1-O-acyltransferase PlsY [bacterium]|nr:glycerol-3-phosphate 1-O-acyltransferase PlsY [bacterium]
MAYILISILVSYLLGAIPFGFLIARAKGIDIREHGSKNIGATNVKRVLGKGPGNLTLALDILKGYVAVTICPLIFYNGATGVSKELFQLVCAVGVIAGHSWTVFLKFKGGKGVATATGAFFGIAPVPLLCAAAVYGISAKVTRYVSVSSMLGSISFVVFALLFGMSIEIKLFSIAVAAIIVIRHKANIKRLIDGTENKIGDKSL